MFILFNCCAIVASPQVRAQNQAITQAHLLLQQHHQQQAPPRSPAVSATMMVPMATTVTTQSTAAPRVTLQKSDITTNHTQSFYQSRLTFNRIIC